jgi:YggT family protein
MSLLVSTLAAFLNIYMVLIFIRILLTWFQTADWAVSIMSFLSPITDPYLNLFRSLIPPLGGIDFSPWLAIIILQVVGQILNSASGQIASATFTGY